MRGIRSHRLAEELRQDLAAVDVGVLGLLRGGVAAGADGPDGLVGDGDLGHLLGGQAGQTVRKLLRQNGFGLVAVALLELLADGEDDQEPGLEGGMDLFIDKRVAFAGTDGVAALGVSENHVRAADVRRASPGLISPVNAALGLEVAVLGAELDGRALEVPGDRRPGRRTAGRPPPRPAGEPPRDFLRPSTRAAASALVVFIFQLPATKILRICQTPYLLGGGHGPPCTGRRAASGTRGRRGLAGMLPAAPGEGRE